MKTLLSLAITALVVWSTAAPALATPPPPANVNFVSERGQAFSLTLDGRALTRPVARQVHVDRLVPGQHWADFSLPTPYGPPLRFRTAVWLEPGLETSYVLVLRPGGPRLRQVSAVALGGPRGYGYGYEGGYSSPPATAPYGQPDRNGGPANAPYGNYPEGYDTTPVPAPNSPGYPSPNAPSYPSPNGPGYGNAPYPTAPNGGYYPAPNDGNYLQPLAPADVQDLTQALRDRPFDNERLPMVKQALAQGSVRADELAQLVDMLSFDKSRIELAKFGYAHLSDPQNFYRVYEVLRYPSSIREVQQALDIPQN